MKKKFLIGLPIILALSLLAVFLPIREPSQEVGIDASGNLAVEARVALAAQTEAFEPPGEAVRYLGETVVTPESWGYRYTLENGDIVEVGDSTTVDFKAHVKTIRWNGVADFSLWLEGGTFVPTLDGNTISFDFSNSISVKIYPVAPCERSPEGGIEYDIALNKKPAQPTVTFNIDWNGITWTKLLPLDEEYDQAACEEEWGIELAPFTIASTSIISDVTSEVLLTREEYEVNSYIGEATTNWHSNSGDLGGGVTYSKVSRSYLHIHRGQMTDDLGDTAWVEDINLNESKKEIIFTLPKTWLKNATYPVHQVCGLDPAYTEDMDSWVTDYGSDNTWEDYDIFTNHSVPKGAVAETIIANQEPGVEAYLGIRTDGSSNSLVVELHEAEGGGVTTCRMFVLIDASTGLVETYADDVSDVNIFYLVGYWENVGWTEGNHGIAWAVDTSDTWEEKQLGDSGAANRICFILAQNLEENVANTMGVRATSSALERKVLIHEQENGGVSAMDYLVKADANYKIDIIASSTSTADNKFCLSGYFGSEMDFGELFTDITAGLSQYTWNAVDLTAYLDEDGRVCDFLLTHYDTDVERTIGARDGDDTTTNRYIFEHEAEDDGGATGELTGFGISAKSNSSGVVNIWKAVTDSIGYYLMGYFKPAAVGAADISNAPGSKAFGTVKMSTSYWSNGSAPTWPLDDSECYFTVTNSGNTCSITIKGTNFTGGVGWTLAGSPGTDIVTLKAAPSGTDLAANMTTLTTSEQSFISGLGTNSTKKWEMSMETPTLYGDAVLKESTITLTATLD